MTDSPDTATTSHENAPELFLGLNDLIELYQNKPAHIMT